MISRPEPANWFQMLVARDDLPRALSLFAGSQGVEPQTVAADAYATLSPQLAERLERFQHLARIYRSYWPDSRGGGSDEGGGNPLVVLDQALAALERWRQDADPLIRRLETEEGNRSDLERYIELAEHLGDSPLDLSRMGRGGGPWLGAGLYVLSLESEPPPAVPGVLLHTVSGTWNRFYIAVGVQAQLERFAQGVAAVKGRSMVFPDWLPGTPKALAPDLRRRLESTMDKIDRLRQGLAEVGQRHEVAAHLRAAARLKWFFDAMERVGGNDRLALVEGWTDGDDPGRLNALMRRFGARALVEMRAPGAQGVPDDPPMILKNPWWAKPFELFPRLLGTPGANEADPSRLLFFIAPLLFGYMFGDVGQGAVLFGAGWLLRGRFQAAWLLIFGGLSAMFFGWMFGSFFCIETLFPPLWVHPARHPLEVLGLPLILGVLMIAGGLGLDALERLWCGAWRRWLYRDAGVLGLYLGVVWGVLNPWGWVLAALGLVWYLIGNALTAGGFGPFLGRLGHLLEGAMQLAVNTLSFARVGAFALAHAGLSQAVVTLAGLTGGTVSALVILLLGNLLILALEGLVVSVQTTRLILFEFFVRFLRGAGRPFRPLPPPPE